MKDIDTLYQELPDDKVKLYASHTTRFEGFMDILLSGKILSSQEVWRNFGNVQTHRGMKMPNGRYLGGENSYISFAGGHVCYKYFNREIRKRDDFTGGVAIFVPLEKILEYDPIGFSHVSDNLLRGEKLTKENFIENFQVARKRADFYGDGYGNLFEIGLWPEGEYMQWTRFPQVPIGRAGTIIALPKKQQKRILKRLEEKRIFYERYRDFVDACEKDCQYFEGLSAFPKDRVLPIVADMAQGVDWDSLNVDWFEERNVEQAMKRISIENA